ncbi:MAG: helix-turn-helix transcriptional regulator [Candidatus Berkiella sp.]
MPHKGRPLTKRTVLMLQILGKLIKSARLEGNMSQEDLAQRLNVSRLTIINIEKGTPNVSIGSVFEAATIVGVPLISDDIQQLKQHAKTISGITAILPKRSRQKRKELDNDF